MAAVWEKYLKEVLIEEKTLQARIKELGQQISTEYAGKDLLLIGILKGSVMFMTDLMRQITVPHEIDFIAVSSYGKHRRESKGVVRILKDLDQPVEDKHLLIIEDIVDSGYTLSYITRALSTRNPHSLKICTLLDKKERRQIELDVDYTGFVIPDKFVFGYGLDLDEKFRELPFIGVVNPGMIVT